MSFPSLGSHRLLFVTGKGGVGKTTIAAGLAQALASQGKSVLLVALDQRSEIGDAFGVSNLGFDPVRVSDGLSVMVLNTEAALQEYLKLNLKVPIVTKLGPLANAFDFLANAAPGVREILTIGKLCHEVRQRHYDVIVADSPATGHIVGYLAAPEAINSFVRVGLIRSQTDWMVEILHDPAQCGVVAVTTPEEMPVVETQQLLTTLAAETSVRVAAAIVNRMPEPVLRGPAVALAETLEGIVTATRLAISRRAEAERQFDVLASVVNGSFPIITQPNVINAADSVAMTAIISESLAEEIS